MMHQVQSKLPIKFQEQEKNGGVTFKGDFEGDSVRDLDANSDVIESPRRSHCFCHLHSNETQQIPILCAQMVSRCTDVQMAAKEGEEVEKREGEDLDTTLTEEEQREHEKKDRQREEADRRERAASRKEENRLEWEDRRKRREEEETRKGARKGGVLIKRERDLEEGKGQVKRAKLGDKVMDHSVGCNESRRR